jgi:hypothetical protein
LKQTNNSTHTGYSALSVAKRQKLPSFHHLLQLLRLISITDSHCTDTSFFDIFYIHSVHAVFTRIQDGNFFLIHPKKGGGSSYNCTQSTKNRANVFVVSNTVNICLGWVVQLFRCVIVFCFITYHATSCMPTSVSSRMLFPVVVLWNVSRLGSTLQLFPSVKMAYETPRIYHVLYHASRCMSMMCTLFSEIEYTLSLTLIFITNLTNCSTFFT